MRQVLGLIVGFGLLALGESTAAWAQGGEAGAPPPPIDETTPALSFPLFFPSGGSITQGTIGLCEGPLTRAGGCTTLSDVLHFFPASGGNASVLFLSEFESTNDVPPDTGIPPGLPIDKFVPETALANGAEIINYIPASGTDPGAQFDDAGRFITGVDYNITSDPSGSDVPPVPEPPTIALAVAGLGPWALGYLRTRSRQRHSRNPV